jgi:hypothetical protein
MEKVKNYNVGDNIGARIEEEAKKARSAWARGVFEYVRELWADLCESIEGGYFDAEDLKAPQMVKKALLNGADSWSAYSWGGSSLIYNGDIAARLCCPSELKKTREGERRPNASEEWLDTQARALFQASAKLQRIIKEEAAQ